MQRILETAVHKDFGFIVKVIEVRTSYKLHDNDSETMPLMSWVVVAHDVNDQIREIHHYDKPIKAQRKFERLTSK
jgi:hypothetical protein